MSDDTRPDFGKIAQSLGNFTKEASASIDRQIEKKKVKDSVRPGKFCDVCECLFDYRPKPTIILEENHQAPIAEGRCNKCKKEVKAGFIAQMCGFEVACLDQAYRSQAQVNLGKADTSHVSVA